MKQFITSYALLAFSFLVFLASVAVPVFIYVRTHTALSYVARVHGDISAEGDQERKSRSAKQQTERTTEERALLQSLSVEKDDVATFISSIEAKARSANVTLEIGSVTIDSASAESLRALLVQTKTEGSQGAVMKFLQLIETLPEASYVRSVSFEKREKTWVATATLVVPIKQ